MKKRGMGLFIAMGGIALVLIIASIFLIVSGGYKAKLVLVNDGFFVGDQVHDCLYETDENAIVTTLPAIGASQSDILYEKSGKYYIGNEYTPVSLNFPYVINNASAVMFTSGVDKLITGTFEYVDSYENLYMSGGVTFNSDMERAYREDFILVDTGNGIYMNAEKLSVGGALTTAAEIPVNSFIRFLDNEIVYYYYEDDALLYSRIAPVSRTASITLGNYNYTYIEFLEKLGLYSERKTKEKISPTPSPAPERDSEDEPAIEERKHYNFSDPNYVPADNEESDASEGITTVSTSTAKGNPTETDDNKSVNEDVRDDEGGHELITPNPGERPTRAPRPTSEPAMPEPAGDPLPAEEQPPLPTPTPRPTATPLPTPTMMPVIEQTASGGDPAVPEAPAAAAPADPVPAKEKPEHIPTQYVGTAERPLYFEEWKKPIVHLGDITTGTYTIFLDNFHIENSQFLYKRYGVQFSVKEGTDDTGKLVYTKNVTGGGALRLGQPFKPNTQYTLEVILNYINAYGETMTETVLEYGKVVVETKGRDFLESLDFRYTKGIKASNSFILNDVGIGLAVKNTAGRFIESVEYLGRVEFEVTNEGDSNDTRIVTFSNTELNKLRKGETFKFESSRVFRSNSTYKYLIRIYDKTGELLNLLDENGNKKTALTGKFKTCTEMPRATFRVQNNKIFDFTVAMRIANTGNAGMRNLKYRVLDMDGNVVWTTSQYLTAASGGAIEYTDKEKLDVHSLESFVGELYDPATGAAGVDPNRLIEVVTKFSDLSDQSVYVLQVISDCDVYAYDEEDYVDGIVPEEDKWITDAVIGETKFTTANISSLGNFFIENVIPATDENLTEGQLYMNLRLDSRTNELLIDLVDDFDISFWKNTKDADGKETGNYVLDENAKISYMLCVAGDDTQYMDIRSVVEGTRPADLERWENNATLAGQNAYDKVLEENFNSNLGDAKNEYIVTVFDDEGNEITYNYDYFANLAFEAQNRLNAGGYASESEEYAELTKIIEDFALIKDEVEQKAISKTREDAEKARDAAYKAKYLEESGGDTETGYVKGKLTIGEDIVSELKAKNNNPDPASGSSIVYKYEKELRIAVTGLETNTTYEIRGSARATVGNSGSPSSVRTILTRSSFKTYRKRAIVKMDAYYASSTFISLFGVRVDDPDEAITNFPVELTVTNRTGGIMGIRTINSREELYDEMRFNNLATEEEYTLRFLAKGYNQGWSKASEEINKEIFVNDLKETLKVVTHESIKADISIMGINDAYDLAPEVRVMVAKDKTASVGPITGKYASSPTGSFAYVLGKNSLSVDGSYYVAGGGQTYYVHKALYTIDVNLGSESYNIIEPGIYPTRNRFTHYQLFADEDCTIPLSDASDPNASVKVTARDAGTNAALSRCYWTRNYIRLNTYLTGQQRVYLLATALNLDNPLGGKSTANSGVYMFCGLSFHRFGEKAYTANINAILRDEFGQLGSNGVSKYYVRVYEKEGEATSSSGGYRLVSERLHEWRELAANEPREHADDNCMLEMYEYDKYGEEGRGPSLGTKTFVGGSRQIDTNFGVRVAPNKYYRLELWIKLNNYSIRVGTVNFTSERIIHSIDNVDDLLDAYCHPSDSYIVTSDLRVARANIFNTKQFDGVIDFNGHTLTHMSNDYLIYTLGAYGEIRNLVFEKGDGVNYNNYKNIRGVTYENYGRLDNIIVRYKNRIETIDFANRDSTNFRESQYVQGLICSTNYPTGVVENFCIDVQEDIHFYAGDGVGLAVYTNYGMVRNGYSCSSNGSEIRQVAKYSDFEQLFTNKTTAKTQYTGNYYTGGLVRRNVNGIVESTFGLVDMKLKNNDTNSIYKKGAAICGLNEGYVRNSFSAASVLTYREAELSNGAEPYYEAKVGRSPANQNFFENNNVYGHSSNIFHYSMYDHGKCLTINNNKVTRGYDSVEVRKELLHDKNWYSALFDSTDITRPGQWNYEFITRGCYPQVEMGECMPAQPSIMLPALTQTSTDIVPLVALVTEQNDIEAYATLTFYNPNGFIVTDVFVEYLSSRVVQQWEEGKFYYVRVRLNAPVKYYSTYNITGFRYTSRSSTAVIDKQLDSNRYLTVNAEFYKMVRNVSDFASINYGPDENYMLANDIDFFGYNINDFAVCTRDGNGAIKAVYNDDDNNNCFTGKFVGNNMTLSNIDVGDVGFLFGKVASKLKDFKVENIHTADQNIFGAHLSTAKYMGIVATMREGGGLDNVHVNGARFENVTQYCGVLLARNFFENEITNCSVRNAVITTGMPADNSTAASVGGLVGNNDLGLIIRNCFIDGFEIRADQAGDVYGIGGLVGYTVNGIEIENVYAVHGRISTNYANAGGLIGSVQSMNDVSTSGKGNYYTEEYFIRNYYTDVELVTMADNIGGVIGYTSKVSGWDYNYGVNFGRIVSKSTAVDPATLGPVIGFYTGTSNPEKKGIRFGKHQYAYESYEINGDRFIPHDGEETETSRLAYFKTLSYEDLTNESTYGWEDALNRPILAWKDGFEVKQSELSKGIMPKLYYTYTNDKGEKMLLPDQGDFSLMPNEVEVESVTVAQDSGVADDTILLTIVLKHDSSVKPTGFDFEGTEWNGTPIVTTLFEADGRTIRGTQFFGTPLIKTNDGFGIAKDKYFITAINYKKSETPGVTVEEAITAGTAVGKQRLIYVDLKIKSRWLIIDSVSKWNTVMSQANYGGKGYNLYIAADLNFSDSSINAIPHNVIINSMIGRKGGETAVVQDENGNYVYDQKNTVTISGIRLYEDDENGNSSCFIEQATGMIAGINFENCTVSQTYDSAVNKNKISNKTALIGIVNGKIEHVSFKNINILGFTSANMAPVGLIYSVSKDIALENINVIQHKKGNSYVSNYSNRGGYTAFMGKFAGIDGLTANRIYVDAAGACMGGIVGVEVGGTYLWNINATDIVAHNRTASSFVGGIVGNAKDRGTYQRAGKLHVNNVFVKGHSYVGGIAGRAFIGGWNSDGYRRTTGTTVNDNISLYAQDLGTTDTGSVRSWVKRGLIFSYAGESVGGAVGLGGVWKTTVEDSTVIGGNYTGGVIGRYAAIDCKAENVYVSRWHEKVEGEKLFANSYQDIWPSMFYRPGGGTVGFRQLIYDSFASTGGYKTNPGYGNSGAKTYLKDDTNYKNHTGYTTSHDYEQATGEGQYFVWKNYVTTNVASDENRKNFWDEAVWGITAWYADFGAEERTHGRPGKVFTDYGEKLSAMSDGQSIKYHTDGEKIKALSSSPHIDFKYSDTTYNTISTARYDYIGGAVGYAMGLRNIIVENCMVYAPKSLYVGGITGRSSAYDSNYTAFGGNYSFIVKGSTIIGGDRVGGAIGEYWRYNAQAIFIDDKTLVEGRAFSKTSRTGTYVGGIAGRIYMGSSSAGETPQIKYVISAANVVGKDKVGGIVGGYEQDFYTNETDVGWMMLGNVIINANDSGDISKGGMLFNRVSGSGFVNKAAVYDQSELMVINNPVDTATNKLKSPLPPVLATQSAQNFIDSLSTENQSRIYKVTDANLKQESTYVTTMSWPDFNGVTSGNYTTKRFKYDKLSDGYMPALTMGGAVQNSFNDGIKDLYPFGRVLVNLPGVDTNQNSGGTSGGGALIDLSGMPQASVYASGVDTISVDFSRIDPAYDWTISIGGQVLSGSITEKTLSFTYDFTSDVTLVVSGSEGENVYTASGADLAHYVSAAGGSYYYITNEGVARGTGKNPLPTRYGEYVNIFGGKALEKDGSIIDLETGTVTAARDRMTVLGEQRTPEPLYEGQFGNYRIETYADYSVTTDVDSGISTNRDGFLFYTDGNTLQSIRTGEKLRSDTVILWCESGNTYFAALGSDRKLNVLLDGAFKVPEGVSTEGISEMSNSRDLRTPYCIVRYANGGLCAFNFVTGEILFEQGAARGLASGGGDASSGNRALSFSRAMELNDALTSGAVDLNGLVRTSPAANRESGVATELIEGDPVDGDIVSTGDPTGEVTNGIKADGNATETGDESVDGQATENLEDIQGGAVSGLTSDSENEASEKGTQPEASEDGSDSGDGPSGIALINDETAASNPEEGDLPVAGEEKETKLEGNTINGTNRDNGDSSEDGEVSKPREGDPNVLIGETVTTSANEGVDPELLASVEAEVGTLVEEGSLSLEYITEVLGVTEVEAASKLYNAAAAIAEKSEEYSIVESITMAYRDIVMNPYDYIEAPVVRTLSKETDPDYLRDIEIIRYAAEGKHEIDASAFSFVPVYNPETGEYELFETNELLMGEESEIKSIEERIAENGKFINTSRGYKSGVSTEKPAGDYRGLIAVLVAILLAGGLTWAMIYKKRKEGSK